MNRPARWTMPWVACAAVAALVTSASAAFAAGRPAGVPAASDSVVVTVHADHVVRAVNRRLVGFNWHTGGAPLQTVAPLRPAIIRIDASLERVSPAPGRLDLGDLLERVAQIRSIGAEPLVILSYTPPWLAQPNASFGDPTKTPPRDLAAWQQVVHDVVFALATAPTPARWFEAWNEPDLPTFWTGLPTQWLDTAAASARAVSQVQAETGISLRFGGPASVVPDPVLLAGLALRLRAQQTPLGFVSWHYYGNLPCLGPDGPESGLSGGGLQQLLGCRNPLTLPAAYGAQIDAMRAATRLSLLGSGWPDPPLLIDEWNLSSGGLDRRHDTEAGAAFDAATLMQMQAHGLNAATFYAATDTDPRPGNFGLVRVDGSRKPAWWSFWLWQKLEPQEVLVDGNDPTGALTSNPAVIASRSADGHTVTALVAAFDPSCNGARSLTVRLAGLPPGTHTATLRRIDPSHPSASHAAPIAVSGDAVHLTTTGCSVTYLEVHS